MGEHRRKEEQAKASLAIAIIAKNAAKTIGACLDSVVPYVAEVVVCVDANTTDETAKVAKKHGARVFTGLQVSERHECPEHGIIQAQHFARARQASFAKLRTDVDFIGWLDADDILKGGDKLATALAKIPPEVAGLWLPYHYATAGDGGPTTTLFDRERIVRASMPWAWQHRVHEILAPVGVSTESLNWSRTDEIGVWHQGEGHDTFGSARRNITLLEIDLEENPEDMRAWYYLGNQYFALGEWTAAVHCYEKASEGNNPYQLWQTLIYLSMAYEKLGDLAAAKDATFRAIDVQPNHADPYYRLATIYMLQGDLSRTEFWTAFGDKLPEPPFFVFRNPLDKPYNARLTLATAYASEGMTSKARQQLELAARAIPSKQVMDGIAYHKELEEDSQKADAWVSVLEQRRAQYAMTCSGNFLGNSTAEFRGSIPENIWRFGRVRDAVVPSIIRDRDDTSRFHRKQPRIVFFCGRSLEPWAPPSLNTTGIGGSETAVIQIAKRFARNGYRVDVYNDCDKYEGEYEGVGYWDCNRLQGGEKADVLVSWRNPQAYGLPIQRDVSLLWCHDLNSGPAAREAMARYDKVLGVSAWHAAYTAQLYGLSNTGYVPNGIELDRFAQPVKKTPFQCVYASSPDRGLDRLLLMWPEIVKVEPDAVLHIAYGWENIDKVIAMGDQRMAQFKNDIERMLEKTPNVVWRGRLAQDDLAKLYQESVAWLYPTSFLETFCISAVEAMAAGCVPVTSAAGALPETIGDGGIVVMGNTYTQAWRDFWVQCANAVLHVPDVRVPRLTAGHLRAGELTWDKSFENHWQPLVGRLLEGAREQKEVLV